MEIDPSDKVNVRAESCKELLDRTMVSLDLRPKGLIKMLNLLRPIYQTTAAYGHFGRTEDTFSWEKTDKVDALKDATGLQ